MPIDLPTPITALCIESSGRILRAKWENGEEHCYHSIWLRDNGLDSTTRDKGNGQKRITLQDIDSDIRIHCADIEDAADSPGNKITIQFRNSQEKTWFHSDWLRAHYYDQPKSPGLFEDHIETWETLDTDSVTDDYQSVVNSEARLLNWLDTVNRYGFAMLSGLPPQSGAILKVVDLFGYIRETNYGKYFEVRSEPNPVNLAFTSDGLQLHTDNPYRDPVPTLQLLACLENESDGGDSVICDGFHAAKTLKNQHPQDFELLSKYSARFNYRGSTSVHLSAKRPMLECNSQGQLTTLRFNNRSCDALMDIPFDEMEAYYAAYRRLSNLIDSPQGNIQFRLKANQLFIVDNTRVLHGRTGFESAGKRWLQGAYADKDSLQSKLSTLKQQIHS